MLLLVYAGALRQALYEVPNVFEWIAGILTVGLLVYLVVALLKPEWFS
jgi:K+-transporting ATPase KdpF subunit